MLDEWPKSIRLGPMRQLKQRGALRGGSSLDFRLLGGRRLDKKEYLVGPEGEKGFRYDCWCEVGDVCAHEHSLNDRAQRDMERNMDIGHRQSSRDDSSVAANAHSIR